MSVSDIGIPGAREFPATSWSALLELKDAASPEYQRNLRRLIELYWKPVYWVVRRSCKSTEDAEDLTQEFFADAVLDGNIIQSASPERGSFRAFLRGAITRFMYAQRAGPRK